ncbi:very short patch repair endonuclease [Adhaeribacter sp. BT258]|uniref:Very short patch repair endonuclease n=1 Tax=Adhaeribacter terrigena TaxID=2793070 RepID=A0ABS1BZZ6_9BACT|nr:very short patch repair endonuclease [Adhaeribacter terrigena]MBK0402721.1 very short patch repair endonuclease [Adhaeribacter terrigena]
MADYKVEKIKVPKFEESQGFYTTKERSLLMAKIKGKNTKPELALRKGLWNAGFRYRVNYSKLPGKPDMVSKKYKVAIFVDGEFWHGYNWQKEKKSIKANSGYWIPKIQRNMQRDQENNEKLELLGYKVFRFWEHEIRKNLNGCIDQIFNFIRSSTK